MQDLAPCKPWPAWVTPLDKWDAMLRIMMGEHREAREMGQNHHHDRILLRLLEREDITCALDDRDTLYMRATAKAARRVLSQGEASAAQ
jgi:hypothetical protein